MSNFDKISNQEQPGNALRDQSANFLSMKFSNVEIEKRIEGKKVDIYCSETKFGKTNHIFVEVKDYSKKIGREKLSHIFHDYNGLIEQLKPSIILIITRNGLTTDGSAFIDSNPFIYHQTVWDLENETIDLISYIEEQTKPIQADGIESYYISQQGVLSGKRNFNPQDSIPFPLIEYVDSWVEDRNPAAESHPESLNKPLAILGGYGAGKSSFAKMLFLKKSQECLADPTLRRPVLIKLGNISRYSSLDGLLGALFTSSFVINGYSYEKFMEFNRSGRLLIILDGFDEMKFAMSWADFKFQIKELNQLINSESKVILLGRPSAFLSDSERLHILKGAQYIDGNQIDIPGWPKFHEIDIEEFDKSTLSQFINLYTGYLKDKFETSTSDPQWNSRIAETLEIASSDLKLFKKPVHAKILVEIACYSSIDLSGLKNEKNRWSLYEAFFQHLAERENDKDSRRQIGDMERLDFLEQLCFWLWSKKEGSVSFQADDVPVEIYNKFILDDLDPKSTLRELLVGAFVERKSGDIYYFSHRSFCEFLVARHIHRNPPKPSSHSVYAKVIGDGVQEFLKEKSKDIAEQNWVKTLPERNVSLNVAYMTFLVECARSQEKDVSENANETWAPVLRIFSGPFTDPNDRIALCIETLKSANATVCSLVIAMLAPNGLIPLTPEVMSQRELVFRIVAALLENLFSHVREDNCLNRITIERGPGELILRLIKKGASGPETTSKGRYLAVNWARLIASALEFLADMEIDLLPELTSATGDVNKRLNFDAFEISQRMGSSISARKGSQYLSVRSRNTLDDISLVQHVARKKKLDS